MDPIYRRVNRVLKSLENLLYEEQKWGYLGWQKKKGQEHMGVMIWHGCCRRYAGLPKAPFVWPLQPRGSDYPHIWPKITVPFLTLRNMTPFFMWFGLTCISGNVLMHQQTSQSSDLDSWVLLAHCHRLAIPVPTENNKYSNSTPLHHPFSVPWIPSSLSLPISTHSLKSSSNRPFYEAIHSISEPPILSPHWSPLARGGKQRLLGERNICKSLITVPDTQ